MCENWNHVTDSKHNPNFCPSAKIFQEWNHLFPKASFSCFKTDKYANIEYLPTFMDYKVGCFTTECANPQAFKFGLSCLDTTAWAPWSIKAALCPNPCVSLYPPCPTGDGLHSLSHSVNGERLPAISSSNPVYTGRRPWRNQRETSSSSYGKAGRAKSRITGEAWGWSAPVALCVFAIIRKRPCGSLVTLMKDFESVSTQTSPLQTGFPWLFISSYSSVWASRFTTQILEQISTS